MQKKPNKNLSQTSIITNMIFRDLCLISKWNFCNFDYDLVHSKIKHTTTLNNIWIGPEDKLNTLVSRKYIFMQNKSKEDTLNHEILINRFILNFTTEDFLYPELMRERWEEFLRSPVKMEKNENR